MKTVTIVAHSRPKYVAKVVSALTEALMWPEEQTFDLLIFSVDPGHQEVADVCGRAAATLAQCGVINSEVYINKAQFGPAGNTLVALGRAFDKHHSDFNLALEDDAVLSSDSILLANWFFESYGGEGSPYTLMSMCNHRDFGKGQQPTIPDDPSYVVESPRITSPFAWCLSSWQWPFTMGTWNAKKLPPNGWDFSLSYAMRLARRRALHPVLSRCRNIGRDGGTFETQGSFDRTQVGLSHSDGSYGGGYKVVGRIPDSELEKLDDWMVAEYDLEHTHV